MVQTEVESLHPFGAVNTEVIGKGIWYEAPALDAACGRQKEIYFMDDERRRPDNAKGIARISPTYDAQSFWTMSTQQGWCIHLGEGLTATAGDVDKLEDVYTVQVTYEMSGPSVYWECVPAQWKTRDVRVVETPDGKLELQDDLTFNRGDCPHPGNGGWERESSARPKKAAKSKPSASDVREAITRFDDALWEQDYEAAQDAVSCFNLFEKSKYGSCGVSEFINVGPIPRSDYRTEHGPPWNEYGFKKLDGLKDIVADKKDDTLFHVHFKHERTNDKRSVSVQWVDGEWKLFGVVSQKGEGLTSARFVYDLHDRDRREIFDRRLAGENIDDYGESLDPLVRAGLQDELVIEK
jgi:hypothetical protein